MSVRLSRPAHVVHNVDENSKNVIIALPEQLLRLGGVLKGIAFLAVQCWSDGVDNKENIFLLVKLRSWGDRSGKGTPDRTN